MGQSQHTLAQPVRVCGVGLHTGADTTMVIKPNEPGTGICFRSVDVAKNNGGVGDDLRASVDNVVFAHHGTVLGNSTGARVSTIEHVMAALAITKIDNALIEITGGEIPIADGSAVAFVDAINTAGRVTQKQLRRIITVREEIRVVDGDRSIEISPADEHSLEIEIEFADCLIGRQSLVLSGDDATELAKIAHARTFCRHHEVAALHAAGLGLGGSLENSLVVEGDRLLNKTDLRDPDEFVRHKALDLIGDLYLLGAPLRANIRAIKPGHALNVRAVRAVAAQIAGESVD